MDENGKRNGRTLVVIGSSVGASAIFGIAGIAWNALRADMADNRAEIHELRREVAEIQKLAAERGKTIPELERRITNLEKHK